MTFLSVTFAQGSVYAGQMLCHHTVPATPPPIPATIRSGFRDWSMELLGLTFNWSILLPQPRESLELQYRSFARGVWGVTSI